MNHRKHGGWVLCLVATLMALPGCTRVVRKIPQLNGTDADKGLVRFNYDQWNYEIPNVQWEDALSLADKRCKDWGYPGVLKTPNPEKTCINGQPPTCMTWDVTTTLYCKKKSAEERPAPAPLPVETATPRRPDTTKFDLASQCSTIAYAMSALYGLNKTTDAATRGDLTATLSRQSDTWSKVSRHLGEAAGLAPAEMESKADKFRKELAQVMKKKKDYVPVQQYLNSRYGQCIEAAKNDPEILAIVRQYAQ